MAKWTYGDEGSTYPVRVGEVWKVGQHVFACSDLMADTLLDETLEGRSVTAVYCDPPWGQALLNGFRTKAGLDKADHRWEELYRSITRYGSERGAPVWLEGSKPDSRDGMKVLGTMTKAGQHTNAWFVKYYRKHPSGLYYTGKAPYPRELRDLLTGMDDDFTPLEVMRNTAESGTVVDPCAGRGVTSRCAEEAGWVSVNNELNPHRVSAALVRMGKMTGMIAERVK